MFRAMVAETVEDTGCRPLGAALTRWDSIRARLDSAGYPAAVAGDFMALTGNVLFLAQWARILERTLLAPCPDTYQRAGNRVWRSIPHEIHRLAAELDEELDNVPG